VLTRTADAKWWQEKLRDLEVERDAAEERARTNERTLADVLARLAERDFQLKQAEAANKRLNGVIQAMQATRLWRLGGAYWNLRDRLLRRT
jgi:hypothetical protein